MISDGLEGALADIDVCETTQALRTAMQRIVENYGFASYDFVDAGSAHAAKPFHFGTTERQWEDAYTQNNFVNVDPCIAKARRSNIPFVWEDIGPHGVRPGPKSPVKKLMDAANDFGFSEGLVVPCHFRDQLGRSHSVSSVFFWKDRLQRFKFLVSRQKAELHLLMLYFIQKCIDLSIREGSGEAAALSSIQLGADCALTDRERDILAWAGRGKTINETADILALSELTVETHVKNALRKLGVHNKTHAVAKAIMLGLIDY